jgi:hypothetical protein
MTITVDWDNPEKTTLYYQYTGKWTWDEYKEVTARAHALASTVDYPVDVIADFSGATLLPENALGKFKASWQTSPMKVGTIAIITSSVLVERLASIFQRVNSNFADKFRIVKSLDEAHAYIASTKVRVK